MSYGTITMSFMCMTPLVACTSVKIIFAVLLPAAIVGVEPLNTIENELSWSNVGIGCPTVISVDLIFPASVT